MKRQKNRKSVNESCEGETDELFEFCGTFSSSGAFVIYFCYGSQSVFQLICHFIKF